MLFMNVVKKWVVSLFCDRFRLPEFTGRICEFELLVEFDVHCVVEYGGLKSPLFYSSTMDTG